MFQLSKDDLMTVTSAVPYPRPKRGGC